ncbi:MAG: SDR family oxidoreductase [Actinobacteria bacterium]|nr:SDR family oxidoreductase [Actinomycetota bacterium]
MAEPAVVLLSGGSRGLGLHLAEHLLAGGHTVATFARSATADTARLEEEHAGRFVFRAFDGRDQPAAAAFVNEVAETTGGIDALVNCAAVGQDHLLANMTPEAVRTIIAIDIEAPLLLTRLVLRHFLVAGNPGRIVNISSICGSRGYPGLTVYSAAKGALDAFTRSLAREVGERGILVNAIAPGFFESEMSAVLSAAQLATIKRRTPTGQLTVASQIAAVLDLLLFADTNMTGQVVYVDGGITG